MTFQLLYFSRTQLLFEGVSPSTICRICVAEVETPLWQTHITTLHPAYAEWSHRWRRWLRLTAGSYLGFLLLDLLSLRLPNQTFQYAFPGYIFATFSLLMWQYVTKMRAFSDAWQKDHPVPDRKR